MAKKKGIISAEEWERGEINPSKKMRRSKRTGFNNEMPNHQQNTTILSAINHYLNETEKNKGRKPNERYTSFDYCYNYFYSFYKDEKTEQISNKENIQTSCLQLGFYLASWGMLRGSSFLLQKSSRHYVNLIEAISEMSPELWAIDVDTYNEDNLEILLKCKRRISIELGKENNPSDTLITKIMLGVFGNVPAFDQYVKKSFKIYKFDKRSLRKIKVFYENNKKTIDEIKIPTIDFWNGNETSVLYPKAKIIDMYGFIEGQSK
ncbi:MAG: hypothetical protein ACTSW1_05860 [Candidatus Hodarchaeales archaeon]